MFRFVLCVLPLVIGIEAQALTFKSDGSVKGQNAAVPITADMVAACATESHTAPATDMTENMQVMSYNIRYDNGGDGKNNWTGRAPKVASLFAKHDVDLGGLQEVLHNQMEWLQRNLTAYEFVGVGRDDGKQAGEYAPIFFRKSDFELVKTDTVWLSKTPDKPGSRGWDAALPRITTFAVLRHKASGKQILLGSAHYDHRGKQAKRNSASVIHDYISKQTAEMDSPLLILTGDFNDVSQSSAIRALENQNCLFDAHRLTDERSGPNSTWNGFRRIEGNRRIDYVFMNPVTPVLSHVIDDSKIDRRFPSDHLPVIVSMGTPQ